jgi:hypothetical protein
MRVRSLALALPLVWSTVARAESPEHAVAEARRLRGEPGRDRLRRAAADHPDSQLLALARAESYLADDNSFWALRVLDEFVAAHPPACQARTFIARIHIDQANLEQAEAILGRPGCDAPAEIRARKALLRAVIAQARRDAAAARRYVREARETTPRYVEDEPLLDSLSARFDPNRIPLGAWSLALGAGYTTNGLAGMPLDRPSPAGADGSAISMLDLRLRAVVPTGIAVRPVIEAQLQSTQLYARAVSGLSTDRPTLRAGALLGTSHPRLLLDYGFDLVQLHGGDLGDPGPLVFSEGHRGEYSLELSEALFAFGSAGYRRFHDGRRARVELEQGLAAAIAISDTLEVTVGASGRAYDAEREVYDAVGVTGLLGVTSRAPKGWELRQTLALSGDRYPRSAVFFLGSAGRAREDSLLEIGVGVWTPSFAGFSFGVDYGYTRRDSLATAYRFTDHRTLLHGVWQSDTDHALVSHVPARGRVLMRHGSTAQGEIRERMRRDDAVQRGTSCLK